jgi:hypothetical protein
MPRQFSDRRGSRLLRAKESGRSGLDEQIGRHLPGNDRGVAWVAELHRALRGPAAGAVVAEPVMTGEDAQVVIIDGARLQ